MELKTLLVTGNKEFTIDGLIYAHVHTYTRTPQFACLVPILADSQRGQWMCLRWHLQHNYLDWDQSLPLFPCQLILSTKQEQFITTTYKHNI